MLTPTEDTVSLKNDALDTVKEYRALMDNLQISDAVKLVWKFITRCNKFIDETAPWKLAKAETQKQALINVLYNLAESLRIIAILISPFMPTTSRRIFEQLQIAQDFDKMQFADAEIFGKLENAHVVGKPEQLFPRIEI